MKWRNNQVALIASLIISFYLIALQACHDTPYNHGKIMYENFCANCHMEDGSGLEQVIPPLAGADYLLKHKDEIACIIRYGQKGEIIVNGQTYNQEMTASPQLTDNEITNIINYINSAWGNNYGYTKITEVKESLKSCEQQ